MATNNAFANIFDALNNVLDEQDKKIEKAQETRELLKMQREETLLKDTDIYAAFAQRGKVAQCHVVFRTGERVGKARAVDIERQALFAAERADGRKLLSGIERTVLRRLGEVDHPGHDRVVAVRVVLVLIK